MNKALKTWEDATEELTKEFLRIYFPDEEYDVGGFVACCIGDVYCVNETYFFCQEDMVTAIKYDATYDQLIEYYDEALEAGLKDKRLKINFKNFIKWGWEFK